MRLLPQAAGRQVQVQLASALLRDFSDGSQGLQVSMGIFLVDAEGMMTRRRLLPR